MRHRYLAPTRFPRWRSIELCTAAVREERAFDDPGHPAPILSQPHAIQQCWGNVEHGRDGHQPLIAWVYR